MLEVDIALQPDTDLPNLESLVETSCAAEDLHITLKGTLAKYPGCTHWHFKKGRERGTLELTWWPAERRLWFNVSSSRAGAWLDEAIARLRRVWERERFIEKG